MVHCARLSTGRWRWLRRSARLVDPATIDGALYRIADYPGLVPGSEAQVRGDLFVLADADVLLAVLDDYEECAGYHPQPHEYRRERRTVRTADGPVDAWVYLYIRDVTALPRIDGGDFLSCAPDVGG